MNKSWNIDNSVIRTFQDERRWYGSGYELSLVYPREFLDVERRNQLFRVLWNDPSLLGVVASLNQFGQPWQSLDEEIDLKNDHYYGCLRLPTGDVLGCRSFFLERKSEDRVYCSLYLPLSMLNLVFPVEYPVTDKDNAWIAQVDKVLVAIGTRIYRTVPFEVAALGEEASAVPLAMIIKDLAHDPHLLAPDELFRISNVAPYGFRFPEGLWWTGGKNEIGKR